MSIHRRMAPRRFVETVHLESDPEVKFLLRFTPQEADELANYVAPSLWGNLCRVAVGFVTDWEGVNAEDGSPVPWSVCEFYGRLTAAERLEFAQAVVELVFGEQGLGPSNRAEELGPVTRPSALSLGPSPCAQGPVP